MGTWTHEEDRLLLRHRRGTSWARVMARTGRTEKQCKNRLSHLRAFQRRHGRLPRGGEVETYVMRRWRRWEDELLRLALRHMIRPVTARGADAGNVYNIAARIVIARALSRTPSAVWQRIKFLDYDPEELEAL